MIIKMSSFFSMEVIIHSTLPDIGGRVTLVVEGNATVDSLIAGFCVEKGVPQVTDYTACV